MKLNILHCVPDDKFIDATIDLFDAASDSCINYFVNVTRFGLKKYKYIKKRERVKSVKSSNFISYLNKGKYDVIILHSFFALHAETIVQIEKGIKVVWFAWGYDIYSPIRNYRALITVDLYYPKTKKQRYKRFFQFDKGIIKKVVDYIMRPPIEKAIHRIDYFSGVIPDEYDLIRKDRSNCFFRAQPLFFNYDNLESPIKESNMTMPFAQGHNIQVGNSLDMTNNHLDVFERLKQINIGEKTIYVPLSYGGNRYYRKTVIEDGKKKWGDRFTPLVEFMSLEKYNEIINSTQYSIFFLERQQAMGNIYTSLWRGCSVFLSETNPVYCFLRKLGFVIFTIQDDLYRIEQNLVLTVEEKTLNRQLLVKYNSIDVQLFKIRKMIDQFAE